MARADPKAGLHVNHGSLRFVFSETIVTVHTPKSPTPPKWAGLILAFHTYGLPGSTACFAIPRISSRWSSVGSYRDHSLDSDA